MYKLEFDNEYDLQCAVNGKNLVFILWELDQHLRGLYKYQNQETIGTEDMRTLVREIMSENGLTFEHKIFE